MSHGKPETFAQRRDIICPRERAVEVLGFHALANWPGNLGQTLAEVVLTFLQHLVEESEVLTHFPGIIEIVTSLPALKPAT